VEKLTEVPHGTPPDMPDGPGPGWLHESWDEWADACFTHDDRVPA
jgi:hypothetical protein